MNPSETIIVIRSLVPGGVAQQDGRLIPGDRLLFVNDMNLENASLEEAVQVLKGAPKGVVQIGVAKPHPVADGSGSQQSQQQPQNPSELQASCVASCILYFYAGFSSSFGTRAAPRRQILVFVGVPFGFLFFPSPLYFNR